MNLMKTIEVKTRLPEDVHAKLKKLAIQEGRSMNKQIIWILTHFDSGIPNESSTDNTAKILARFNSVDIPAASFKNKWGKELNVKGMMHSSLLYAFKLDV